ncbi:MAG: 50S ribosomal protein L35 [Armatimonadetes bacterium]|uniref:Large ribosomal subunit protein bL35 n=1 Tax=Candidatus Nitrosymbiomonas proteolyticus TaxID=2608984 RepID=A0A809S597_9BACT|nr:MAG: 50S ribosomal protein L35 [Armatimonadota bacterium]MBL1151381.1 50S ribosomal protein L35 [Armatimonadota bacterium]MCL4284493.1 50S ribosomal protein L35 [Fimbriimonadaceae bacterium]RIK01696.1 MAG: 50S ribosomal protein L35 [Armatimonadota bacterium]BBO24016.1 50S ribosomal protein L35 [Candidatus Nitrosymbiomonas proteolyticus]
MAKLKVKKSAAKRFKITGTGKLTRRKAYNNHMFLNKSASQKRRLEEEPELCKGEAKRVKKLLGL